MMNLYTTVKSGFFPPLKDQFYSAKNDTNETKSPSIYITSVQRPCRNSPMQNAVTMKCSIFIILVSFFSDLTCLVSDKVGATNKCCPTLITS